MALARHDELKQLITQLQQRRADAVAAGQALAWEANYQLLQSLHSVPHYMEWLFQTMPRLPVDQLMEIQELLPEWDEPIHRKLLDLEQRRFPHLISPPAQLLTRFVESARRPVTLLDLGSGAMEIERRILTSLPPGRIVYPLTIVGVDSSPAAQGWAKANLQSQRFATIIEADLEHTCQLLEEKPVGLRVILCRAEIGSLLQLRRGVADIVLSSLVRHHFSQTGRLAMDQVAAHVGRGTLEYDGYRNWISLTCMSATTWRDPALLAATVMSYIRFPCPQEICARWGAGYVRFCRNGCYLAYRPPT